MMVVQSGGLEDILKKEECYQLLSHLSSGPKFYNIRDDVVFVAEEFLRREDRNSYHRLNVAIANSSNICLHIIYPEELHKSMVSFAKGKIENVQDFRVYAENFLEGVKKFIDANYNLSRTYINKEEVIVLSPTYDPLASFTLYLLQRYFEAGRSFRESKREYEQRLRQDLEVLKHVMRCLKYIGNRAHELNLLDIYMGAKRCLDDLEDITSDLEATIKNLNEMCRKLEAFIRSIYLIRIYSSGGRILTFEDLYSEYNELISVLRKFSRHFSLGRILEKTLTGEDFIIPIVVGSFSREYIVLAAEYLTTKRDIDVAIVAVCVPSDGNIEGYIGGIVNFSRRIGDLSSKKIIIVLKVCHGQKDKCSTCPLAMEDIIRKYADENLAFVIESSYRTCHRFMRGGVGFLIEAELSSKDLVKLTERVIKRKFGVSNAYAIADKVLSSLEKKSPGIPTNRDAIDALIDLGYGKAIAETIISVASIARDVADFTKLAIIHLGNIVKCLKRSSVYADMEEEATSSNIIISLRDFKEER